MREYRKFCRPKTTKFPLVGDVEIKLNCGNIVYVKYKEFLKNLKIFKINSFVGESSNSSGNILVTDKETGKKAVFSIQDYSSIDDLFEIVSIIGNKKDPLEVRSYVDSSQGDALEGDIILHNSELNIDAVFSYNDWLELSDSWDLIGLLDITTYEEEEALNGYYVIMANGHTLIIKPEDYSKVSNDWEHIDTIILGTTAVDLGLPSGTKWASRDIDLTKPGGFCETPFTYEKSFFSWGNIDGHNPSSVSAFDYNWGGVNQAEPWYEGQPYGSTPGNTLNGNIAVGEDFDAARANLGALWRMPTSAEFVELFANIKYINADGTEVDTTKADKRVTVNGIVGLYLESKINGARLFFSCSGFGDGRSWDGRGSHGYYWSSTWNSARYARNLNFKSGGVYPQNGNDRYYGFAVRAVQSA